MSQPEKDLVDRLDSSSIEWPPKRCSHFIPIDKINELINEISVHDQLKAMCPQTGQEDLKNLAKSICRTSRRLFGILIICEVSFSDIRLILDSNHTDEDLPFQRIYSDNSTSEPQKNKRYTLGSNCNLGETNDHAGCKIGPLGKWRKKDVEDLDRNQWTFLSPVFEYMTHQDLGESSIMPFITDKEGSPRDLKSGGYSEVWPVRIHPAHHNFQANCRGMSEKAEVAIKRLYSKDEDEFKRELGMLTDLTGRNNPHLIKLLASYKFRGNYHFIFPYATSNLRDYWASCKPPAKKEDYLWVLQQMRGLISGLNAIHNFQAPQPFPSDVVSSETARRRPWYAGDLLVDEPDAKFGRHGDLKPENILVLENQGFKETLQISDFGLGRFHRFESRSRVDPNSINGSPTYTPPDLALKVPVSRAYDIWSMGCVFLEFITWVLEGSRGLQKFANQRGERAVDGVFDDTFFSLLPFNEGIARTRAIVREPVSQWIEELMKDGRSAMIRDVLRIVRDKMIKVEPAHRISAQELVRKFEDIWEKAEKSQSYILKQP